MFGSITPTEPVKREQISLMSFLLTQVVKHNLNNRTAFCSVEYLVFDESDKLFELGFVEVLDSVVDVCSNPSIVRSLFSAALPHSIEALARTIMHDAIGVIVGRK
jgi:superfamily II DNA/RNA helicase